MEIKEIIDRLKSLRKFNITNHREGEFNINTERNYDVDGDYIDSFEIDDIISDLENINTNPEYNDVKQRFINLIGEDRIKFIEENNFILFYRKPIKIYESNEIDINFLTIDGKGDTVTYLVISYNEDNYKWFSDNSIDEYVMFDTYSELRIHLNNIKHEILEFDGKFPNLI